LRSWPLNVPTDGQRRRHHQRCADALDDRLTEDESPTEVEMETSNDPAPNGANPIMKIRR
jgi:hypothetical protein